MRRNMKKDKLVIEEQLILDELIDQMDDVGEQLDFKLKKYIQEAKRAKEQGVPEAYGTLVVANVKRVEVQKDKRRLKESRDELYEYRIIVKIEDEDGTIEEGEYKVGLHEYSNSSDTFIHSWKMPVFRHYLMDNTSETFDGVVKDKNGQEHYTIFNLLLKRKVDLRYTHVDKVNHFYPISENKDEEEKVIYDEFLQELFERRSEQEFKNIVFSIQKKQGEIIQTKFEQNIIVQGCAGSGKSMIMLHRLPILIYDNPNSIDKNNIYIITPSLAYMQMAENMREELEITDLRMGTARQYYDYSIEKYGREKSEYGEIDDSITLTHEQQRYIYSELCIEDIRDNINEKINKADFDSDEGLRVFNLESKDISKTGSDILTSQIIESQRIIEMNNTSLKEYYSLIRDCLNGAKKFRTLLYNRKSSLLRTIALERRAEKEKIERIKDEIASLNPEKNKTAIDNHILIIADVLNHMEELNKAKEKVNNDTIYFEKLGSIKKKLDSLKKEFSNFKTKLEIQSNKTKDSKMIPRRINYEEIYEFIPKISLTIGIYHAILYELSRIEDKYTEYESSLYDQFENFRKETIKLEKTDLPLLNREYYKKIVETNKYLQKLKTDLPIFCYTEIMEKLGQKPDRRGILKALSCSPYLYLQILYQFQGSPNARKESLITMDEAQDFSSQEILLLRKVNDNQVIFNLLGDEKQHIEGKKGIKSWSEVSNIADFKNYSLNENYRNAKQITNYCNNRFSMNMRAININGSGSGVKE